MTSSHLPRPLLAIPGPVEISPAVREAAAAAPRGHQDPALIEAFGRTLESMRRVWRAGQGEQPFVISGSGTLAMDSAVANLLAPADSAVVVVTGYFSRRLAEMVRRRGAAVVEIEAPLGEVPSPEALVAVLAQHPRPKVVCLTHVDTSTGILLDPAPYAAAARAAGALVVLDGVCATGGERLETTAWGIDVALTGSQKALGLPPGLALLVVSERAIEARRALPAAPPMMLDWLEWLPIHRAYEERRPAYFATPATSLIAAAAAGFDELLGIGVDAVLQRHRRAAGAMRAVWTLLGLREVPTGTGAVAHTLSNLWLPEGIGDEVRARIAARGAVVAGGLLPELRGRSVRVGHMGWITGEPEILRRVAAAVAAGLVDSGLGGDVEAALAAFDETWRRG